MNRLRPGQPSSFGLEVTMRIMWKNFEPLRKHMASDPSCEQMGFALADPIRTAGGTIFLLDELILPDSQDLDEQSVAGVSPSDHFQRTVYRLAKKTGKSMIEFHTHPGGSAPHFSSTDEHHGKKNACYIAKNFPAPTTLGMIVGNNRFDVFDGVVFDREVGEFRQIDRFEILGLPTELHAFGKSPQPTGPLPGELFDRQQRIPGWNQDGIEEARIGIIGVGGNGAPLLQLLAGIGAACRGFLAICDHDLVEESNLPRIPYAFEEHIGTPKVAVAAQYVARKSPSTPVYSFPCRLREQAVVDRMKMATVLFHCGDNDGGRKEANDLAVRFGIPLIDCGCDIQVEGDSIEAGGQVRLVLPGQNGCLVCCGGYDPSQAALDQMDDVSRAAHASHGYVRGADAEATPSVANLNGLTAQHAVSQFLALMNGRQFASWDYLNFDQFTGKTIPAATRRVEKCPVCGLGGKLLSGDPKKKSRTASVSVPRMDMRKPRKKSTDRSDSSGEVESSDSLRMRRPREGS
jgi:molybdopterin-synthase adenylyltransferase